MSSTTQFNPESATIKKNLNIYGMEIMPEEEIDPKKKAILDKLDLNELNVKTGLELRKEKRQSLKHERVKANKKYTSNKVKESPYINSDNHKMRFKLGNGLDVLTAESLLGLVKLTAPFLFPDSAMKIVLDEDDDYEYQEWISRDEKYGNDAINSHQDQYQDQNRVSVQMSDIQDSLHSVDDKHLLNNTIQHMNNRIQVDINKYGITRLAALSEGKDGWLKILRCPSLLPNDSPSPEERIDYFALCLASHFATCATYVPTDVDSKIRGHCWIGESLCSHFY